MKIISKPDECIGKYATKTKAIQVAKLETIRTHRKHIPVLTHCFHLPSMENKKCWTVMLSPKEKRL